MVQNDDGDQKSRLTPGISVETILVPVASEADANVTSRSIRRYLSISELILIHVIPKTEGGIDPAPLEARKENAVRMSDRSQTELAGDIEAIRTVIAYHGDIVEGILEVAEDHGIDAIVFVPREANRLIKFVSGDTAYKLIHRSEWPILALPIADPE